MRPIDADEVLEMINKAESSFGNSKYLNWNTLKDFVNKLRTIDAVPVVRCKDCKKRRKEGSLGLVWCNKWGNVMSEDDFCAYGERRKNDESESVM